MNNKILSLIFALFMLVTIGFATNYDYLYNPYTGMQDRSLSLNQTGNALIVVNLTVNNVLKANDVICVNSVCSFNLSNNCTNYPSGGQTCGYP